MATECCFDTDLPERTLHEFVEPALENSYFITSEEAHTEGPDIVVTTINGKRYHVLRFHQTWEMAVEARRAWAERDIPFAQYSRYVDEMPIRPASQFGVADIVQEAVEHLAMCPSVGALVLHVGLLVVPDGRYLARGPDQVLIVCSTLPRRSWSLDG